MCAPTTPGIATLHGATAAKVAKDWLGLAPGVGRSEQLVVAVAADDKTEAAALIDLITAAKSVLGREHSTLQRVLQALLPAKSYTNSSPAVLEQVQRNAEARAELADEFGLLSSTEVAKLAGSTARNRAATANRWVNQRKVFTVEADGAQRFPGFQFGDSGRPLPVIAEVLEAVGGRLTGWELALWFTSSSDWLGGELRPVDVLDSDPELVVRAAAALAGELLA
jgi:hypothetical protein